MDSRATIVCLLLLNFLVEGIFLNFERRFLRCARTRPVILSFFVFQLRSQLNQCHGFSLFPPLLAKFGGWGVRCPVTTSCNLRLLAFFASSSKTAVTMSILLSDEHLFALLWVWGYANMEDFQKAPKVLEYPVVEIRKKHFGLKTPQINFTVVCSLSANKKLV